jgi:hypothetical protein
VVGRFPHDVVETLLLKQVQINAWVRLQERLQISGICISTQVICLFRQLQRHLDRVRLLLTANRTRRGARKPTESGTQRGWHSQKGEGVTPGVGSHNIQCKPTSLLSNTVFALVSQPRTPVLGVRNSD